MASFTFKQKLKRLYIDFKAIAFGYNLNRIGKIYQTDKCSAHSYLIHYQNHFRKFKFRRVKLLEIGVGGYNHPLVGGSSLRMWRRYFVFGKIYAIDIFDKKAIEERRIKIFQGSQVDQEFLEKVLNRIGDPDIIIDDGSHLNEHVIESFKILFPKLKDGGIYVIEDTQTSYWPKFGGSSEDLKKNTTMMNFFKNLTDGLNHNEFLIPGYQSSYYDKKICSIHFYHNLIVIYKGDNSEKSNIVENNSNPSLM